MKNTKELKEMIELKKEEMIYIANESGFLSPKTIEVSQDLDRLLTKYQKEEQLVIDR